MLLIKKHRAECADHLGLKSIDIEDNDPLSESEDPRIAAYCVNNGINFAKNKRHEEAIAQFDEAIKI
jgi:hypothetical protein